MHRQDGELCTKSIEKSTPNERLASPVLDCTHAPCLLRVDASPVLIAELNATVCSQANSKEEEDSPDAGDDQANREECQSGTGHDKRSSQEHGRSGCCSGRGVGIRGRVCISLLSEDAVDEAGFLIRESGCDVCVCCRVARSKVDLRNEQRLKCLAEEWISMKARLDYSFAYLVMAGPIKLELILPTYMSVFSSVMVLIVCL